LRPAGAQFLVHFWRRFRSKKIRDDFNDGLKTLKERGQYKAIYDKYLKG